LIIGYLDDAAAMCDYLSPLILENFPNHPLLLVQLKRLKIAILLDQCQFTEAKLILTDLLSEIESKLGDTSAYYISALIQYAECMFGLKDYGIVQVRIVCVDGDF
jgi:hypothetical protein